MQRLIALVLAGVTGCATTTASSAGSVITDIDIAQNKLVVTRCDLDMNVEPDPAAEIGGAVAVLGMLAVFGGSGGLLPGDSKTRTLATTGCTTQKAGAL